ncbi:MAG: aspartoacylase [Sulfurospirillum sp.]|nr:MAG: aspartoacylase [Sulfurospirillum sp.]
MIRRVAVTGGTHGNELTGVYLVKKWQQNPELVQRESFETLTLHTNPEAIKACRRYIDRDLNRSFATADLENPPNHYEAKRACELNALLGPKGAEQTAVDFILDLHSTTANMGLSLVVSSDSPLTWEAVRYLCAKVPELKVYRWRGDEEDAFVDSIAPNGFAIEVGPVPQGVLRSDLFMKTEALVYHLLDFFERRNSGEAVPETAQKVTVYDHVGLIDYPRDANGDLDGMVHEARQDQDFTLIKQGDPLFRKLDGTVIRYEGEEPLYTLFINEAAYYEKGFAMTLARKITL